MSKQVKPLDLTKYTKPQRRVIVAKDVIQQLRLKKINATRGSYLKFSQEGHDLLLQNVGKQLQTVLPQIPECGACAIGSLFIGFVSKFNQLVIPQNVFRLSNDQDMIHLLNGVFSSDELREMEADFEQYNYHERNGVERDVYKRTNTEGILKKLCYFVINTKGEQIYRQGDFAREHAHRPKRTAA